MKKVNIDLELTFVGQEVPFSTPEIEEILQHVLNALVRQINDSEDGIAPANGDAITDYIKVRSGSIIKQSCLVS